MSEHPADWMRECRSCEQLAKENGELLAELNSHEEQPDEEVSYEGSPLQEIHGLESTIRRLEKQLDRANELLSSYLSTACGSCKHEKSSMFCNGEKERDCVRMQSIEEHLKACEMKE